MLKIAGADITSIMDMFADFFLSQLFGDIVFSVAFLLLIMMAFLLFSDSPKITLVLIPLILLFGFASSGYVAIWVSTIAWVALGFLWYIIMKRTITG